LILFISPLLNELTSHNYTLKKAITITLDEALDRLTSTELIQKLELTLEGAMNNVDILDANLTPYQSNGLNRISWQQGAAAQIKKAAPWLGLRCC